MRAGKMENKKKAPAKKKNLRPEKNIKPAEGKSVIPAAAPAGEKPSGIKAPAVDFPIVGMGAAAAGLEAFDQFFTHMPSDAEP